MAKTKTAGKKYNHILIPKHEKISEKQKQDLLREHNCSEDKLPKISIQDSAISDSSPKPGDVYRITRNSEKEKSVIFYRVVVNE